MTGQAGDTTGRILPGSRDDAIDRLARHLYWTMERFDPSEEVEEWSELAPFRQEFYRACVRELLRKREELRIALG